MSSVKEYFSRWYRASHAMQAGVGMKLELGHSMDCEPKHLRVGINNALVDHAALVGLLIKKGFITELEYAETIALAMELERSRHEADLTKIIGQPVKLQGLDQ
jgi:hypothetical protein